jgi:hypothetical protein
VNGSEKYGGIYTRCIRPFGTNRAQYRCHLCILSGCFGHGKIIVGMERCPLCSGAQKISPHQAGVAFAPKEVWWGEIRSVYLRGDPDGNLIEVSNYVLGSGASVACLAR